ncbi:hypothetical protein PTI98_009078 [Pleurotus ostreatus]|nr:hypothetical protein PTI98_009078 [Pleurotus ostreatus]
MATNHVLEANALSMGDRERKDDDVVDCEGCSRHLQKSGAPYWEERRENIQLDEAIVDKCPRDIVTGLK